ETTVNGHPDAPVDGGVDRVGTSGRVPVETVRTSLCRKVWTPCEEGP
ncbi:MAG: hypothetical protein JWO88_1346, partial [Frankiales bacterium]|nr:hypothetical protein [Frankiales bacterium]